MNLRIVWDTAKVDLPPPVPLPEEVRRIEGRAVANGSPLPSQWDTRRVRSRRFG